ncbi:MAG: nucleotide exchange factor GrpE [Syntrophales bacterium]|nr:nucleotide exchange factor GrpE [Syntrophales bacterium]
MTRKKKKRELHDEMMEETEAKAGENQPAGEEIIDESVLSSLDEARKEAADNYEKYLRLAAEFDNHKKRVQKERADLLNYGNETIVRDILPIVDSLERALEHASNSADFDSFVQGLQMILEQLRGTLARHGVEAIDAIGSEFDPNFHEAMMRVESGGSPDNQVVEEFEKGYLLKGRLLRPSKVSVAKTVR